MAASERNDQTNNFDMMQRLNRLDVIHAPQMEILWTNWISLVLSHARVLIVWRDDAFVSQSAFITMCNHNRVRSQQSNLSSQRDVQDAVNAFGP